MTVGSGTRLGPHEILSPLGAGGMGNVYRARDTKLGRDVAVKILPEAFAQDRERLARFEREARLLASLNHPNIAIIYDLEESDGVHFLVLELVPGESLAECIKRGPIPVDEALPIFNTSLNRKERANSTSETWERSRPIQLPARRMLSCPSSRGAVDGSAFMPTVS